MYQSEKFPTTCKISPIKKKVACGVGNQGTQRKCWFLFLFFFTGLIAVAIVIMQSSWWEAAPAIADAVLLCDFVNVICQFW